MAITQVRGNTQIKDGSVDYPKMAANFLQSETWTLSSDNSAKITGLTTPTSARDAVTKEYVDGIVDSVMKSPDGFATNVAGDYPSDYKGTGGVAEGDAFYVTDVSNGTDVGTESVNVGDLLIALADTPGNTDSNWIIVESNREYATHDVPGIIELATQTEADAGADTLRAITPATLNNYILNNKIEKIAGQGMSEDASANFNISSFDASINVKADTIEVQTGSTNGASLETTATGLELASAITGARSFSGGAFSVDAGAGTVSIKSGGVLTLDATADNVVLTNQPTGGTDLSVATIKYVDDSISSQSTDVFNELPTVTSGNANVTLLNTPTSNTERVYLNGVRQAPGASNDYTISGTTVTFASALHTNDFVLIDYKY